MNFFNNNKEILGYLTAARMLNFYIIEQYIF